MKPPLVILLLLLIAATAGAADVQPRNDTQSLRVYGAANTLRSLNTAMWCTLQYETTWLGKNETATSANRINTHLTYFFVNKSLSKTS